MPVMMDVEVKHPGLEALRTNGLYKHRSEFPPPGPEVSPGARGCVRLESMDLRERIIQDSNLLPVSFLEEGALRQRAVARLPKFDPLNPLGQPWGTGFLVSNSVIMTNNHVISSAAEANEILVQFNYQTDPSGVSQSIDTWRLDPTAFFYTNVALDFTLVKVKGKSVFLPHSSIAPAAPGEVGMYGFETLPVATPAATPVPGPFLPVLRYPGSKWGFLPLQGALRYAAGQLLNCVQHPAGRMKEVAVQKSAITHVFDDRVHYTTDTEPGSSGSPVFNNAWDLVALHHAAGDQNPATGAWLDNEGMRIDAIVSELQRRFATVNPQLLAELNLQ